MQYATCNMQYATNQRTTFFVKVIYRYRGGYEIYQPEAKPRVDISHNHRGIRYITVLYHHLGSFLKQSFGF